MKIDIFSGFLGAGKTTLIKKLIKEAFANEKVVLIENEFGEIGIDGGFLRDAGIEITEMNSGCICCSLVGDFAKALQKVTAQFSPDRIIIEPSGVGKLSDVEKAVEKGLDGISVNAKTTVVNAKKCLMYAKNFGEFFLDQLENADCVVLSHTDETSEEKTAESLAFIKEHNPEATVVASPLGELDGKDILSAMEKRSSLKHMTEELMSEQENRHCHHHGHGEEDGHCCHHHDHEEDDGHRCRHHDHEEDGHSCHHHDHEEDDGHRCHHHEHGEEDGHCCHHHDHGEEDGHCHHHRHGHDADEVFVSWGKETANIFSREKLENILANLGNEEKFGTVLRAKGIVRGNGEWIHFDYIPDGKDIRLGSADVIGKICVIGSKLNESALSELFGL